MIFFFFFFFKYLEERKLRLAHQPGFRANDSCINQPLSIISDIYTTFDAYPALESCGVFIDLCKDSDELWHKGLIFKLKAIEISNALLEL